VRASPRGLSQRASAGVGGAERAKAALVGAVVIAGAGTLAWNAGAIAGLRWVGYDGLLGMAVLGFVILTVTGPEIQKVKRHEVTVVEARSL
jgi:hypothetical protein